MSVGIDIFKQETKFIAGVANPLQFPKRFLPEIAFFGKSNVGKSSLINTICRRKNLARTSNTPGRTRQINFFSLADKLLLVDLPGYGFAKVSFTQKQNWENLILHYLQNSDNLKLVNLLIDARFGVKPNDIKVMSLLNEFGKNFQIIFTKNDKSKKIAQTDEEIKNSLASLGYSCNVISTSSKSGSGAKEVQFSIIKSIR